MAETADLTLDDLRLALAPRIAEQFLRASLAQSAREPQLPNAPQPPPHLGGARAVYAH